MLDDRKATDCHFGPHGKEQLQERRERAKHLHVPLMRVNGVTRSKQRSLIEEPEEQATQEVDLSHHPKTRGLGLVGNERVGDRSTETFPFFVYLKGSGPCAVIQWRK